MAVSILAIKFNHHTNAASHDALNIRIDANAWCTFPEVTPPLPSTGLAGAFL